MDRRALTLAWLLGACAPSTEDRPGDGTGADTSVPDSAGGACGLPSQAEDPVWGAFVDDLVRAGLDRYAAQGLCFDAVVVDGIRPRAAYDHATNTLWVDADDGGDVERFVREVGEVVAEAVAIRAGLLHPEGDGRWPGRNSLQPPDPDPGAFPYVPERAFVGTYATAPDSGRWAAHALFEACAALPTTDPRWSASLRALDAYLGLAPPPEDYLVPFASRFTRAGSVVVPETFSRSYPEVWTNRLPGLHYELERFDPLERLVIDLPGGGLDGDGYDWDGPRWDSAYELGPRAPDPTYVLTRGVPFSADGRVVLLQGLPDGGVDPTAPSIIAFEAEDGEPRWLDRCATSEVYAWHDRGLFEFEDALFGFEDGSVWFVWREGTTLEWFRWIADGPPAPP